ncbi:PQ loop repeat-domain-containing protein [Scheffersomyces coipomensis]|uniref:PQ loop repeat-domain-containing protein n=1 Tax=Scheffersomyces coipomensis TaxID=1788519 RepID=UPI00315DF33B
MIPFMSANFIANNDTSTFSSSLLSSSLAFQSSSSSYIISNITLSPNEQVISSISKISGILSLSVWLFAQLPQIIENHLNESVEGVSLAFLCCWIGGDTTNLIGCILTKALPFQTLLATYYCFIDCILSLQFWYYTRIYPKQKIHHNLLQSPNMLRPVGSRKSNSNSKHVHTRRNRFEQDITRSPMEITNSHYNVVKQNKGSFIQRILAASFVGSSLTKPVNGMPIHQQPTSSGSNKVTSDLVMRIKQLFVVIGSISIHKFKFSSSDIGQLSAWICSILYLSSRSPQIVKNYKSKSTKGISAYLFLFAMLGNLFYTISIVADLYLLSFHRTYFEGDGSEDTKFHQVLTDQLPFIVGSSGTVIFDCIILFQCWYYLENSVSRNSSVTQYHDSYGYGSLYDEEETDPHHHHHHHHHHKSKLRSQSRKKSKRRVRKNSSSNRSNSPGHFQKPDWYTNTEPNFPSIYETAAFGNGSNHANNQPNTSNILNNKIPNTPGGAAGGISAQSYDYLIRTPPPSHYIAASQGRSITNQPNQDHQNGLISTTLNAITKSLSYKNENPYWHIIKSPHSSNSGSYDHGGVPGGGSGGITASSPLTTSLIPSIIGNYSSVSKKMSHDSKIPFSPIDFLTDEFHRPVEGSYSGGGSSFHLNNHNHE